MKTCIHGIHIGRRCDVCEKVAQQEQEEIKRQPVPPKPSPDSVQFDLPIIKRIPMDARATTSGLLMALHEEFPEFQFALREPYEEVYAPPATIWERIVQLFTGPKMIKRHGIVHVSVHGQASPSQDIRMRQIVNNLRPAHVRVEIYNYDVV